MNNEYPIFCMYNVLCTIDVRFGFIRKSIVDLFLYSTDGWYTDSIQVAKTILNLSILADFPYVSCQNEENFSILADFMVWKQYG